MATASPPQCGHPRAWRGWSSQARPLYLPAALRCSYRPPSASRQRRIPHSGSSRCRVSGSGTALVRGWQLAGDESRRPHDRMGRGNRERTPVVGPVGRSARARALAGTEEASSPFFSPNGEWLGFFTPTALKKIRISGGALQTLAPVNSRPRGAAWGEDDSIVFSSFDAPLRHLPPGADGSATIARFQRSTARPGRSPVWLPGRRVVLYEISTFFGREAEPSPRFDLHRAARRP